MSFCAQNVQTPGIQHRLVTSAPVLPDLGLRLFGKLTRSGQLSVQITPENDVSAATRHVGGDGDYPGPAGLGNDFGFLGVVLGVQDLVFDLPLLEPGGQLFRGFHRGGAHQYWRLIFDAGLYVLDDGVKLFLTGQIHQIVHVIARHGLVGGNDNDLQPINLTELESLGISRTGHAGQLLVQAEIILEGGRGQGLALTLDFYPFLRLNGLVQPLG